MPEYFVFIYNSDKMNKGKKQNLWHTLHEQKIQGVNLDSVKVRLYLVGIRRIFHKRLPWKIKEFSALARIEPPINAYPPMGHPHPNLKMKLSPTEK